MAALPFERLLAMPAERSKADDLTMVKAALAYRRAGDVKNSTELWKKLEEKIFPKGGLKINGQLVAVARLQEALDQIPRPETGNLHDWPMIRGNNTNSAQAIGSQPLLDMPLWERPLLLDEGDEKGKEAQGRINQAITNIGNIPNTPVLAGSFPIALGKVLIYRSYSDVRAVFLQDQKDAAGKVVDKAGDIFWKSTEFDGGLATLLDKDNNKMRSTVEMWLNQYYSTPAFSNLVYENSLLGTIATDHRFIYAVDDLAVPAPSNIFQPFVWNQQGMSSELKALVMQNCLYAFELSTGKIKWRWGVPLSELGKRDPNDPFADSHFLGVPISVGGKLYVLNEKNNGQPQGDSELRLVCLDPNTGNVLGPIQSIGNVLQHHRFTPDASRRLNAAHLAYGEGILVCPTNAGEVLGVDLLSRTLAWAYPYRERMPNTRPINSGPQPFPQPQPFPPGVPTMMSSNWKVAPP